MPFHFLHLLICLIAFTSTSCDTSVDVVSNNFTYELSENGCSTGKQNFSSKDDMCIGLKNNALNNNCAYNSRQSYFSGQQCSGSFTTFIVAPIISVDF